MGIDVEKIREKWKEKRVKFTHHALSRLDQRKVKIDEIGEVIESGKIVEEYAKDKPYPSCLLVGTVRKNEPLYVLCASGEELVIVTVHWHDPEKWVHVGSRRKR